MSKIEYADIQTQFKDNFYTLIGLSFILFFSLDFILNNYRKARKQASNNYFQLLELHNKIQDQNIIQKKLLKQISSNEK